MAGIYIHIPFCRKICSYCDFYKTTSVSFIPGFLAAMEKELELRRHYLQNETIETLYIGGGTPSLLKPEQLQRMIEQINNLYSIEANCEITLEANPDDLSFQYLKRLHEITPVNRLSIGIQSFSDDDLKMLNRRHNAKSAILCVEHARMAGFSNISIDLIYGLPGMNLPAWEANLETAFSLKMEHISAYHLSIEPGTAFSRLASRGLLNLADEEESAGQFVALNSKANKYGFMHYEISNLAREGFFSKHNSNYWQQKKYLGIGPSAHSFDLTSRQWNISNIRKYCEAITAGKIFFDREELTEMIRYNEYLMVSLRTAKGADLNYILNEFGKTQGDTFQKAIKSFVNSEHVIRDGSVYKMTLAGWLISDYILGTLLSVEN